MKARADALKAEKDAFTRQEREQGQAAHTQSIDRAETKAAEAVRAHLVSRFTEAGMTPFAQQAALREIGERIDQELAADDLYQSIYDSILLQPPGEAREKALINHMLTFTNNSGRLGRVAGEVIGAAGKGASARPTTKGANPAQDRAAFYKAYADAHGGQSPSLEQWFEHVWRNK